jgi:cytidine deaminase
MVDAFVEDSRLPLRDTRSSTRSGKRQFAASFPKHHAGKMHAPAVSWRMIDFTELIQRAREAAAKAYAPYSMFQVGCALVTQAGGVFTGCNVENASYGLTICAERNAIFHAVASEGPQMRIASLAVIALGHEFPPCGACRQVIAEFAAPDAPVCFLQNGLLVTQTLDELLPSTFQL